MTALQSDIAADLGAVDRNSDLLGLEEFELRLSDALNRLSEAQLGFTVLMLETRGVGRIDRALGHPIGRRVLDDLGRQLRGSQPADTALSHFAAGRFVLLAEGVSTEFDALRLATDLLDVVRRPRIVGGMRIRLTASVGIVVVGRPDRGPPQLLRDADAAVRTARRRGHNQIEVFEPETQGKIVRQLQLEADLGAALERDEFELHFQPIVSSRNCEVIGLEALLRWRHPERGPLAPGQFISVAENAGLMLEIGDWTMAKVCTRAANWLEQRPDLELPPISINVSAVQLCEGRLESRLSAALMATGLPASSIALEITESSAMEIQRGPLDALEALKRIGVKVYLDDFGTGHSSLAWLARLPIDGIKLDRAFVADLDRQGPTPILSAVVEMGRALSLTTVAEGIETSAQLEAVRTLGADAVQGFLVTRPAPAVSPAEVETLIARPGRQMLRIASKPEGGPNSAGDLIGLSEAAQTLGVSPSTMRRHADSGALPVERTAGGHRRFRRQDVRRLARHLFGEPLAPRELPGSPLVTIGGLLDGNGPSLVDSIQRGMYMQGHNGWFAAPQGRTRTGLWIDSLSQSVKHGNHRDAIELTASYLELAMLAGASVAECVRFLTQLGQATSLEALRSGAPRDEVRDWQRLIVAANECFLERLDAEREPATPRPELKTMRVARRGRV